MSVTSRGIFFSATLAILLAKPALLPAQQKFATFPPLLIAAQSVAPAAVRITVEEAKQRALANNKLLNLANLNAEGKAFAVKAARADYFPKVSATSIFMRFNDDLGSVLAVQGRNVTGPRGRTLSAFPGRTVNSAVLNENSSFTNLGVVQPLTDLLKVRQGVKIAQADEQIAHSQLEKGIRDLASGVEQLYWGMLATRRIQAGAKEGLAGAELFAKTNSLAARTALVEARQGLQQIDKQVLELQEQLNGLLDLPLCTLLELVEPPLPVLPFACADEVIALAVAASPEIREAHQTILKAEAAVAAGKLDYVPSVAILSGYFNQTAASYIQDNATYVGVVGTYTLIDWGKRRNVLRERKNMTVMASLKLQSVTDDIRQKAQKAFREGIEAKETLALAQEMLNLRKEAEKAATTPAALANPAALMDAAKARMLAEVEAVKAELAFRQAVGQILSLANMP